MGFFKLAGYGIPEFNRLNYPESTHMDLSAIIKAVMAPLEAKGSGDWLQKLQPGHKLTGRVISVENDGRVLLDLGGTRVLAQIAFEVKPGQTLNLQVIDAGPVIHLKAVNDETISLPAPLPHVDFYQLLEPDQRDRLIRLTERMMSALDSRIHSDSVPPKVSNAIVQIGKLFEGIPMGKPTDQIAQWLKGAIEDRGYWYESHMADLISDQIATSNDGGSTEGQQKPLSPTEALLGRDMKPQLLIFKDFLAGIDDPQKISVKLDRDEIDFMRHSVDRLLGYLEQQQDKAVSRWKSSDPQQVLIHLMPFQDQQKPVELKMYYPSRADRDDGARQHHIAILLNMDKLGPVRVDLAMINDHLRISFYVISETLKSYFKDRICAVEEALAGRFEQCHVDIYVSREKIDQFHDEDAKGASPGRVDIKA